MEWNQKQHTLDELFPDRNDITPYFDPERIRKYSTFINVKDLEWAKGNGLRCVQKRKNENQKKLIRTK